MRELEQSLDFLRALDLRCARRTLPSRFGQALLNDGLPRVWSLNFLLADENLEQASALDLAAEADRLLGGAGLSHRKIELYDARTGARLDPEFRALGWHVEHDLVMAHCRPPDREIDTATVEEVPADALALVWAEGIRSEPSGRDEEVVSQLVAHKQVLAETGARFFAARIDGRVASYCDLYADGRTGQIESVMTLPAYRNQGLARAVVSRALAESVDAGNELTFLLAHGDDWPKELYRKLGFDAVGDVYDFMLRAA
jgi:ribosomal protein S18 acetylase RimI-like enzyme